MCVFAVVVPCPGVARPPWPVRGKAMQGAAGPCPAAPLKASLSQRVVAALGTVPAPVASAWAWGAPGASGGQIVTLRQGPQHPSCPPYQPH